MSKTPEQSRSVVVECPEAPCPFEGSPEDVDAHVRDVHVGARDPPDRDPQQWPGGDADVV